MDKEYRDNIVGSPYLDEGIGQQLKSKTASAMSAGQAAMGHQLDNPLHAKIKPYWGTFISQLLRILRDVRDRIEPLIRNRQAQTVDPETGKTSSPVTPKQDELLTSMLNLLNSITPSKYLANTLSTNRPENTYSLGTVVKESLWDAAKGDVGLNKIIAGRDPTKILNAFKNKILSLYNQFIMGASKSTGSPKESIVKIAKSIYPPSKYRDVLNKIESIKNTPDLVEAPGETSPAATGTTTSPPASTPATGTTTSPPASTPATGTTTSPSTSPAAGTTTSPSTSPAAGTTTSPPASTTTTTSAGAVGDVGVGTSTDSIASDKNNLAAIILKVIKIIIDTVSSDVTHASKFIGPSQITLPTTWGHPTTTSEGIDDDNDVKKSEVEPDFEEIEGEFLYNFAGKYRKFRTFSIEVKPINEPSTLVLSTPTNGVNVTKDVSVFWYNKSHTNEIYVKISPKTADDESGVMKSLVFRFFDDEVNPKTGTGKQFNFAALLKHAHFSWIGILQNADSKIINEINTLTNGIGSNLGRSLYATVYRKAMEWSPKEIGIIPLKMNDDESVTDLSKTPNEIIPQYALKSGDKSLGSLLNSDPVTKEKWRKSLAAIGYFEKYPGMIPIPMEEYPAFKGSVSGLINYGYKKDDSVKKATDAWKKLCNYKKSKDISIQDIVDLALKNPTSPSNDPALAKTEPSTVGGTTPPSTPKPKSPVIPTEPEKPAAPEPSSKEKYSQDQLAKVNTALQKAGLETLDDVSQLQKFYSVKGGYKISGKEPKSDQLEMWKQIIGKAKGKIPFEPKKKKKKESPEQGLDYTIEMVNPFQKANFLEY